MTKTTKLLLIIAILWSLMICFVPLIHQVSTSTDMNTFTQVLFNLRIYPPTIAIVLLALYEMKPKLSVWKIYTLKFWLYLGRIALFFIFILLILENIYKTNLPLWGTFSSLGLALILLMLLADKFKCKGDVLALSIGVTGGFFLISFWEIPYQISAQFMIPGGENRDLLFLLMPELITILPFVIICFYYKLKPTRITWLLFLVYITFWFVWLIPCERWSIMDWNLTVSPATVRIHEPINWPVYQMVKASKVLLAAIVYTVGGIRKFYRAPNPTNSSIKPK